MKITGSRITSFLNSPNHDLIGTLLYGPDRGLVKERGKILAKTYSLNKDDIFGATVLTSDDLIVDPGKLDDEISALSMFGGTRVIRLRLDHERNGVAISKIIKKYDNSPKMAEAKLIVEAGELTQRSVIRKTFEASACFASIACYNLSTPEVISLIKSHFNDLSINIEKNALQYWAPLIKGDLALIKSEIEKMAIYMGYGERKNRTVTIDDIKKVAAGGQDITIPDVIMNTMSGNLSEADSLFHRAVKGKLNSAVILRGLQNYLVRLIQAKTHINSGESPESAINTLRPPIFYMHKSTFLNHLKIWPLSALHKALSQSLIVEQNLKTAGAPQEAIMGRLLIALSSYSKRRS
ncbi:MAG: DNA polymerase III subunit delta [Hellea sp.]|nr:DNA polymerase III subunit delta [Hellea sp.]MDG2362031.1 DNA polymerase III subunit delta [Hellea sp.]